MTENIDLAELSISLFFRALNQTNMWEIKEEQISIFMSL